MKHILSSLIVLIFSSAAFAQTETFEPPSVAASAPAVAASAVDAAASAPAPAPVVTEHEGKIWKMQECGGTAGTGQRVGNIASNAVGQIVQKSPLGILARMFAADAAGNVVGKTLDDAPETRQVCVTVTFKDGTEDQMTKLPGSKYDAMKLSYRQKVVVRFEDGMPVDFKF